MDNKVRHSGMDAGIHASMTALVEVPC